MITEPAEIRTALQQALEGFLGPLQVMKDKPTGFEVHGTVRAPQGKKMVDGIYFATVTPKPKDVRLYFYPAYTHPDAFADLPEALQKLKKGKSCFHVKRLDATLAEDIKTMVAKGVEVYRAEGWLA